MDKYVEGGVGEIEETQILTVVPFSEFGTPIEIIRSFGGKDGYQQAVRELKQSLYSA